MFCCFELELEASSIDRTQSLRAQPLAPNRSAATARLSVRYLGRRYYMRENSLNSLMAMLSYQQVRRILSKATQ